MTDYVRIGMSEENRRKRAESATALDMLLRKQPRLLQAILWGNTSDRNEADVLATRAALIATARELRVELPDWTPRGDERLWQKPTVYNRFTLALPASARDSPTTRDRLDRAATIFEECFRQMDEAGIRMPEGQHLDVVLDESYLSSKWGGKAAGLYNSRNNRIILGEFNENNNPVIVHEMAHWIDYQLDKNRAYRASYRNRLYNAAARSGKIAKRIVRDFRDYGDALPEMSWYGPVPYTVQSAEDLAGFSSVLGHGVPFEKWVMQKRADGGWVNDVVPSPYALYSSREYVAEITTAAVLRPDRLPDGGKKALQKLGMLPKE